VSAATLKEVPAVLHASEFIVLERTPIQAKAQGLGVRRAATLVSGQAYRMPFKRSVDALITVVSRSACTIALACARRIPVTNVPSRRRWSSTLLRRARAAWSTRSASPSEIRCSMGDAGNVCAQRRCRSSPPWSGVPAVVAARRNMPSRARPRALPVCREAAVRTGASGTFAGIAGRQLRSSLTQMEGRRAALRQHRCGDQTSS